MRMVFTVLILKISISQSQNQSRNLDLCEHLKLKLASFKNNEFICTGFFYINGYEYLTSYVSGNLDADH